MGGADRKLAVAAAEPDRPDHGRRYDSRSVKLHAVISARETGHEARMRPAKYAKYD